jgi:hypothetical protein
MSTPVIVPSEGTKLAYSTDGGSTYVDVGFLTKVKPPGGKVPEVPTTYLGSVAKTFRPGKIPEAGEVTFSIYWDPSDTDQRGMLAYLSSPATIDWKVTFNDSFSTHAKATFKGFITQWEPGDDEDETNVTADVTVRITGLVTFAAGS